MEPQHSAREPSHRLFKESIPGTSEDIDGIWCRIISKPLPAIPVIQDNGDEEEDEDFTASRRSRRTPGIRNSVRNSNLRTTSAHMGRHFPVIGSDSYGKTQETAESFERAESQPDSDLTAGESLHTQPQPHRARDVVLKFWLWEIGSCILSLACLASIVGVLLHEDGKLLDSWQWVIPPTAVVSFIGTLGKASCVLVLSSVLSQMKWLHFQKARSVQHIRMFDSASRGPLGSIWVLWSSKKVLASIAACIMVLTILVDPFVQLVFSFPSALVEDISQQAVFQITNEWIWDMNRDGPTWVKLWNSVNQGFISTDTIPTTDCPSGNCIWPEPIKTLGVCGSCSDVTKDVEVGCSSTLKNISAYSPTPEVSLLKVLSCSYTLNDTLIGQSFKETLFIDSIDNRGTVTLQTMWNSTRSHNYTLVPNEILFPRLNETIIELNGQNRTITEDMMGGLIATNSWGPNRTDTIFLTDGGAAGFNAIQLFPFPDNPNSEDYENNTPPSARCWSCQIHWCEKSFEQVRVSNGGPTMYTVSERLLWFIDLMETVAPQTSQRMWYGFYPDEMDTLTGDHWRVRYGLVETMMQLLSPLFESYIVMGQSIKDVPSWNQRKNDLRMNPAASQSMVTSEDLNVTIKRLADSMSEFIRTSVNTTNIAGQVLVPKTFISVRWAWLALPLALVTTTCVLLAIVAVESHLDKVAVWKDDPLVLLFHRVNGIDILPESKVGASPVDLSNLANDMYVKLDRDTPFTFVRTGMRVKRT